MPASQNSKTSPVRRVGYVSPLGRAPIYGGVTRAWRRFRRLLKTRDKDKKDIRQNISLVLDAEFYRARYPDLGKLDDPVGHFINIGWKELRDPVAWFSTARYLEVYADVKASGINPLYHYLKWGRHEGREVHSAELNDPRPEKPESELVEAAIESAFDSSYYKKRYADIGRHGLDPLKHYAGFGWREGRDPCSWFSTKGYLALHPDVRASGVNPLYHYVTIGRAEQRTVAAAAGATRPLAKDVRIQLVADAGLKDLVRYRQVPLSPVTNLYDRTNLDIHWVIPDFVAGGGGHMTIFRMVRWLEFFGHRCTVWIKNPSHHASGNNAYETVIKNYQGVKALFHRLDDTFWDAEGDVMIATSWDTVAIVSQAEAFKERFYFVQDFEPAFHPMGARAIAAELSYKRDLACLCASTWLKRLMEEKYGRWARHFNLAADANIYNPRMRDPNPVPRIAFYSRTSTPRRAVELGLLALEVLAARGVDFHVDFFGAALDIYAAPFAATDHGILTPEGLADLYQNADIGICFSSTNYSLVPQEMMACGLPIVELAGESTRAVFPEDVAMLAGPDPVEIADAVEALLNDGRRRQSQARKAQEWVGQFTWEGAAQSIEAAILERLNEKGYQEIAAPALPQPKRPHASVIIPTFNGGELLRKVITCLHQQRAPWPFEIVIIDSSSTDGTAEYCRAQSGIEFLQIPKEEFSHGSTRNQAAAHSKGEFIAFLTQDAMPIGDTWLFDLVSALERFPRAAGAFGRHLAWPSATPFTKRDMARHFEKFANLPLAVSKWTDREAHGKGKLAWRQVLHFYSDNNSCLRRSVWQDLPYPAIDYGEDQVWARDVIDAGFEKVYAMRAEVYHSHDYDAAQAMERAAVEAAFFRAHFGYQMLKGSLEDTLRGLNRSDEEWGLANDVSRAVIERQCRLNEARLHGYLKGQAVEAGHAPSDRVVRVINRDGR